MMWQVLERSAKNQKSWAQTPWLRQVAAPNYRNFLKFLDFKNRYIHIFWINMTNQVMKESIV